MSERAWYGFGAVVILALLLVLVLWSILLWIGLALLAIALLIVGWLVWGVIHRRRIQSRIDRAEAAKAEAAAEEANIRLEQQRAIAEQQRALAEQYRAQAAALWNQQHMIPNTMVGLVLPMAADRERVMTWAQPRKVVYNGAPAQIAGPVVEAGPPQRAPIFAASERDMIAPQLLLGYNAEGQALLAVDHALRSGMIVLGRPGEGKSTVGRYWTALSLKYRFPVMVIDPHESILGDLADRFYTEQEGISAAMMAADIAWILDHRISLGGKYPHKFLLIIVDEWAYYQRTCPDLVAALGRVILEGRKYRMCVQILGHGFPADSLGGTTIRDAVSSLYILGSSAQQARLAGLESNAETTALLQQVKLAGPGNAILSLMGMLPTFCSIPDTTEDDLARLLEGLRDQKAIAIPDFALLSREQRAQIQQASGFSLSSQAAPQASEPAETEREKISPIVSPEERARIVALAKEGLSAAEIATAMKRAGTYAGVVRLVLKQEAEAGA